MSSITIEPVERLLMARSLIQKKSSPLNQTLSTKMPTHISVGDLDTVEKEAIKAARVITKRDFPSIATLKLAGRQDKDIAKIYGVPEGKIRPYISRAMAEYRSGKVKVDSNSVREEAVNKAKEENAEFEKQIGGAVASSEVLAEFSPTASSVDVPASEPIAAAATISVIA